MVLHKSSPYGDNHDIVTASQLLLTFLNSLSPADREAFAERCNTSVGHLKNVAYGYKPCSAELAIAVERETVRQVTCESLCPDVDWAYVRGTTKSAPRRTGQVA